MARDSISATASLQLWVRAGGRCQYCNRYLLEDEYSTHLVNLAERAHIVGANTAPGSPRGDHSLPLEDRSGPDNLMLLCREHHRVVDVLIEQHSVAVLRDMKRHHEERIRYLTSLTENEETLVLRMVGGIRGAPVAVPREAVLPAVLATNRFPRDRFAMAGEDLEIDLRGLPEDESPEYWAAGEQIIADRMRLFRQASSPIQHVSVFALTRIPFLVALGFYLDDKIPVTIFQRRRDGSGEESWIPDESGESAPAFGSTLLAPGPDREVSVAVSLTANIAQEISKFEGRAVYGLMPKADGYGRDILRPRGALDAFATAYHDLLGTIERDHPACERIHLFVAAPASAAIQMGRGAMKDSQPRLVVHDRNRDGMWRHAIALGQSTRTEAR